MFDRYRSGTFWFTARNAGHYTTNTTGYGRGGWDRTSDTMIQSHVLCQLSYTPIERHWTREAESNRPLQFCKLQPGRLAIARLSLVPSATIRTGDPLLTRQLLWPTELRGR